MTERFNDRPAADGSFEGRLLDLKPVSAEDMAKIQADVAKIDAVQRDFASDAELQQDFAHVNELLLLHKRYVGEREYDTLGIIDFIHDFPTLEAFDAGMGTIMNALEDAAQRLESPRKDILNDALTTLRSRLRDAFPRLKSKLYAAGSSYQATLTIHDTRKPLSENSSSGLGHADASPFLGIETKNAPESIEMPAERILSELLCYRDVFGPEKAAMALEWTLKSPDAKNYADALVSAQKEGITMPSIREMGRMLKETMLSEAHRLGLSISGGSVAPSETWALWDIGKQYHALLNREDWEKRYPEYRLGNPFEDVSIREDIVNRHLGYEFFDAYKSNRDGWRGRVQSEPRFETVKEYLKDKTAKQNGTLKSNELAELGAVLRRIR